MTTKILEYGIRGFYRKYGQVFYKKHHTGLDLKAKEYEDIYAIADGTVLITGTDFEGFGGCSPSRPGGAIWINHIYKMVGLNTLYGHVIPLVKPGQHIKKGQVIGMIDKFRYGIIKADHLHLAFYARQWIPNDCWGYDNFIHEWVPTHIGFSALTGEDIVYE
ncbi:MAG: M23 family metallopeptidase [Sulfurovaceae bacterium]|nr:M23 family metallopeptidase [Sulfurovaceae bacterium]